MLRVPTIRKAVPGDQRLHGEGDWQVQDHRVARCDCAIVDRGAVPNRDRLLAHHASVCRDHDVAHRRGVGRLVCDGVLLAGQRVEVGVRGEAADERVVE